MQFSTTRNRRDYSYKYETPVRRLGFDKVSKYDELIPENLIKEMNEINEKDPQIENDDMEMLEEMEISVDQIKQRMFSILSFIELKDRNLIDSTDMIGPFFILIFYLSNLFFLNKLRLTYIYIVILTGTLLIFFLIKMITKEPITLYITLSILAYCLLPISCLSFYATIFSLKSVLGNLLCIFLVLYSSWKAANFFKIYLRFFDKDVLLIYPCILFYACLTLFLL